MAKFARCQNRKPWGLGNCGCESKLCLNTLGRTFFPSLFVMLAGVLELWPAASEICMALFCTVPFACSLKSAELEMRDWCMHQMLPFFFGVFWVTSVSATLWLGDGGKGAGSILQAVAGSSSSWWLSWSRAGGYQGM